MKAKHHVYVFGLLFAASAANADIQPPLLSSVHSTEVSCLGERIALNSYDASNLLAFLNSVKSGWESWGFITHPAGDIQINFALQDAKEFWFFTWSDYPLIGTYGEKRKLSQAEAQQLKQLLPSACFQILWP